MNPRRKDILVFVFMILGPVLSGAAGEENLPDDAARFIERRDLCDHFRGEDAYDEERRLFLEKSLREFCTGTDRELARLKGIYRENGPVIRKLDTYEENIEASSFTR